MENYNTQTTAEALAALGHEARLRVFKLLVRNGHSGLNVGEILQHVDLPASTLAHHLRTLVSANLVIQQRQGREILNKPNFQAMSDAISFLTEECCVGLEVKPSAA